MKYLNALRASLVLVLGGVPLAVTACSTPSEPVVEGPSPATKPAPAEYRYVEMHRGTGAVARWSIGKRADGDLRIDAFDASAKSLGSWTLHRGEGAAKGELTLRSTTRAGVLRVDPRGRVVEGTLEDRAVIAGLADLVPAAAKTRGTQLITDDGSGDYDDGATGGGSTGGGGGSVDGWTMPDMPADNGDWECAIAIAAAISACASVSTPVTWPAALGCAAAIAAAKFVCSMKPSCLDPDCNYACQHEQGKLSGGCYPNAGCVCSNLPLCYPTCPGTTSGGDTSNSSSTSSSGGAGQSGGGSCKEGSFPVTCNGQDAGCATTIMEAWDKC